MKSDHRHKHLTTLGTQLWFGPLFHVKNCLGSGGLQNHFRWEDGEEPSATRVPGKTSLSSLIPREVTTASWALGTL